MVDLIFVMHFSKLKVKDFHIKKKRSFWSGYAANSYEFLAYGAGMDCFSRHLYLHNEVLFLPQATTDLKVTIYLHAKQLQSPWTFCQVWLFHYGFQEEKEMRACQDGCCLCLDTLLAYLSHWWSVSALVTLAWGQGGKVNFDDFFHLWPGSTKGCVALVNLASALTIQETGVEYRKHSFL